MAGIPIIELKEVAIWNECVIVILDYKFWDYGTTIIGKPIDIPQQYINSLRPNKITTPSRMRNYEKFKGNVSEENLSIQLLRRNATKKLHT